MAWLLCGAYNQKRADCKYPFWKNSVPCGGRETSRKSPVQKRIWRFRRALIFLRQRKNRMSACCIPQGLARCDGKRTWKTPKAAPSRN